MTEIAGSIWWLIVTLGLLVTFHEFGHFWVARRFGIKVLRFSVGFGKALWSRTGKDGTEYVLAAIPLGGYVKFLDEREVEVAPHEAHQAFNRKSVGARMAVVAAGPLFNIFFAIAAFWLMFVVGKSDFLPIVGRSDGIALEAGFQPGDRLVSIGGEQVSTWTDATLYLAKAAIDREPVTIEVSDARGEARRREMDLSKLSTENDEISPLTLGLYPKHLLLAPVVAEVLPGDPADKAGVRAGDRIVEIDGKDIATFNDIAPLLDKVPAGESVDLVVLRGGERYALNATPREMERSDGSKARGIGVRPKITEVEYDTKLRYGPLEAIPVALGETWRMTRETLALLKRMVVGQASLKNISGPISIAQFANSTAQMGVAWFCWFLAMLSLSIAIMNLMPIPILDGGHLLYYLIEAVKGSPVSEKALAFGQYVGLALLAGLMGLAFYNDIVRSVG